MVTLQAMPVNVQFRTQEAEKAPVIGRCLFVYHNGSVFRTLRFLEYGGRVLRRGYSAYL